jgi:hypothetical protein
MAKYEGELQVDEIETILRLANECGNGMSQEIMATIKGISLKRMDSNFGRNSYHDSELVLNIRLAFEATPEDF